MLEGTFKLHRKRHISQHRKRIQKRRARVADHLKREGVCIHVIPDIQDPTVEALEDMARIIC